MSLGVPATYLNTVPALAGGSFGSKLFLHRVIVLTAALARASGRPVKYIEDRLDNMSNADAHGSDRVYEAELAGADAGFNGTGPGGSRYTVMVAGAVVSGVRTLREKLFKVTAHSLSVAPGILSCAMARSV